MRFNVLFLFSTVLALSLCAFSCYSSDELKKKDISIIRADGVEISLTVEIADTPDARTRGFMEREFIPDGTGMLFIFEHSQILSFWMKNTPHPLSIAYIDSLGKIRNIYNMTPFSEATWSSTELVQFALEVPQGWFEREGIKVGDIVVLDGLER